MYLDIEVQRTGVLHYATRSMESTLCGVNTRTSPWYRARKQGIEDATDVSHKVNCHDCLRKMMPDTYVLGGRLRPGVRVEVGTRNPNGNG